MLPVRQLYVATYSHLPHAQVCSCGLSHTPCRAHSQMLIVRRSSTLAHVPYEHKRALAQHPRMCDEHTQREAAPSFKRRARRDS